MSAIAINKSSISRASTWAGIAVMLTVGITSATSTHQETAGTAFPKAAANAPAATTPGKKPVRHWYQFGTASWYGQELQGHSTASGESFNMYDLTCAHRSLPLGSIVRVTNLRNRKSIVLRVNDRGPVPEDRIIDLSYAAAASIGIRGIARVRLELLPAVAQLSWPEAGGK